MRRHNVQLKRTLSISVENYLLSCNNRVSLNFGKTSHVEFPLLQLSHPNGLNLVFCWTETFLFPRSSASFYITFSYLRGCLFSLLSCCLPTLLTMNAQLLKMLNIFIGINFHPPHISYVAQFHLISPRTHPSTFPIWKVAVNFLDMNCGYSDAANNNAIWATHLWHN